MTQYLLARVFALFALELLLILVGPLVLKEGIAFVEGGRAVSALDLLGAVAVQVAQMDTCKRGRRHRAGLWQRGYSGTYFSGVAGSSGHYRLSSAPQGSPTALACIPQRWQTASMSR